MLGSQVLDTLIGIALVMSLVSMAASTLVETVSAARNKRGELLRDALERLLGADSDRAGRPATSRRRRRGGGQLETTTTVQALMTRGNVLGTTPRFPSYLSSTAFVDAVAELSNPDEAEIPGGVMSLLAPVARVRGGDPATVIGALERAFTETTDRLSGEYKRWSASWLFVFGLLLAVAGNVSLFAVAESLWTGAAVRDAVVATAQGATEEGLSAEELDSVAAVVGQIQELEMPIGWSEREVEQFKESDRSSRLGRVGGWTATALLVTLGAPFWFDLLQRLVALRKTGAKPAATPAAGADGLTMGVRAFAAVEHRPSLTADEAEAAVRSALKP